MSKERSLTSNGSPPPKQSSRTPTSANSFITRFHSSVLSSFCLFSFHCEHMMQRMLQLSVTLSQALVGRSLTVSYVEGNLRATSTRSKVGKWRVTMFLNFVKVIEELTPIRVAS